jgi:hypothetical protein
MTKDGKQALAIFEMICATSEDRPLWGTSVAQLMREMSLWKAKNPALAALRATRAGVQLAFLDQSFEWLRALTKADRNIRVCHTLPEAIQIALEVAPKPFPPELILKLLQQFRGEPSLARFYFPIGQFLLLLSREQVTEEIRAELRKLHLQFAPSPTGKIDKPTAHCLRESKGTGLRRDREDSVCTQMSGAKLLFDRGAGLCSKQVPAVG